MTTDPTMPAQPPTVPVTPPPGPGSAPADASLRRLVLALAGLLAFYVLLEHPAAVPALQAVGALFAIGGAIVGFVCLANRRP
ncbi:hypothetical protein ACGFRG_36315 [Streptomyces sp. NPDC048696]|uniref:hypothetical protein n=1 Tax=Streptomyces sp. NPDC048696 TaxID=3365585 RepID=UPI0037121FA4